MKAIFTFFVGVLFSISAFAVTPVTPVQNEAQQITVKQILEMTPTSIEKQTGKKMNFMQKAQLKIAQKHIAKHAEAADIEKNIYILLAVFSLGWLAMGLLDDWTGNNWIICLVLSLLWLPGIIYALIKMKDYY